MSVPKNKRKESKFEAQHHYYKLRDEVTALLVNDFGFSQEKYEKQIEHFRESHQNISNAYEIVAKMRAKKDAFHKWYVEEERKAVLAIVRNIGVEFTIANSIFPSDTPAKMEEYLERRMDGKFCQVDVKETVR